jgi:hypothetical protein
MGGKRKGTRHRLQRPSAAAAHDVAVVIMLMLLMSPDLMRKLLALFLPRLFSRDVPKDLQQYLKHVLQLRKRKGPVAPTIAIA